MKLITNDKLGLMQITKITHDGPTHHGPNIVVTGVIMGSIPIRTIVTPEEMRKGLSMMSVKTFLSAAWIILAR